MTKDEITALREYLKTKLLWKWVFRPNCWRCRHCYEKSFSGDKVLWCEAKDHVCFEMLWSDDLCEDYEEKKGF